MHYLQHVFIVEQFRCHDVRQGGHITVRVEE
jgi:hypothetical protein